MKKLLPVLLFAFLLAACDDTGNNDIPGLDVSDITLSYDNTSDSAVAQLSFKATDSWKLTVEGAMPDWLAIDPTEGPAGDTEVTVTVTKPNEADSPRGVDAKLTIGKKYKTFSIVQHSRASEMNDPDKLQIFSGRYYDMGYTGTEMIFTAGSRYPISLAVENSARGWLSLRDDGLSTSDDGAYYMEHRTILMQENVTGKRRTGKITVSNGRESVDVTVFQRFKGDDDPEVPDVLYTFSAPETETFGAEGDSKTYQLKLVKDYYDVTLQSYGHLWLEVDKTGEGTDYAVTVTALANLTGKERSGDIRLEVRDGYRIEYTTVTVFQGAE